MRLDAKRDNPVRSVSGGRRPAGRQSREVASVAALGTVATPSLTLSVVARARETDESGARMR